MSLIPLILDCEVPYVQGAERPVSLLALPLGTGTVLDHLVRRLEPVGQGEVFVLSSQLQAGDISGFQRSGPLPIRLVAPEMLPAELERYEASDHLLVVDPRLWPTDGQDFAECQQQIELYQGATHFVAIGANGEGTRERVECDGSGNVRRVQRLYAKTFSEVSGSNIACSVVPLRPAIGCRFSFPLELRATLAASGVLSQDLLRRCDLFRLGVESGFLALTERAVTEICQQPAVEGLATRGPEVLVADGCRIHRKARLVGPLILQSGCVVEEGVTLIGPAVIGAGSRIMRGASVIQSALVRKTIVPPESTVLQRVVCGECAGPTGERPGAGASGVIMTLPGGHARRRGGSEAWDAVRSAPGRPVHFALKRALDVLLAGAALLVLAPLLLFVAILIKLESSGSVFFAHRREGRHGREFPCWKFRTMVADAHQRQRLLYGRSEVDGPQFKMSNDPRVTRVGWWLRSTNIDELPQLFNVLLGHMSLVGPRPSPFRENQICVPWRRARLSVRPGITGLWQVCRDEDRLKGDFHEWIFYDMTYVRHLSIWLDLKILLATVLSLGGKWSIPLGWLLPRPGREKDPYHYSVSAA